MKKIVKCIRKGARVEISNTIASKSAICKRFGAKWDPATQVWTWEASARHPTFDTDAFLDEYVTGDYNRGSNAEYWAHRKKVDLAKANIKILKEEWRGGNVPIDECSSKVKQKNRLQTDLCPQVRDDVFVYSFGSMPCDCRTCVDNKSMRHIGGHPSTFGYIIGKKAAVEEIAAHNPEPHCFIYNVEPVVDLADGRAVALYSLFDTNYD